MAIDLGPDSIAGTKEDRTWRITCFCENGTDYSIEIHRETILVDANGNTLATMDRSVIVRRALSQVQSDPDAIQFLTLAKSLADKWAQEDIALQTGG